MYSNETFNFKTPASLEEVNLGLIRVLSPNFFVSSPLGEERLNEMRDITHRARTYMHVVKGMVLEDGAINAVESAIGGLEFIYPQQNIIDSFAQNYCRNNGIRVYENPFEPIHTGAALALVSALFNPNGINKNSPLKEVLLDLKGTDIPLLRQKKEDLHRVRFPTYIDLPAVILDVEHYTAEERISINADNIAFGAFHIAMTEIGLPQPIGVVELREFLSSILVGKGNPADLEWRGVKSLLPVGINLLDFYNSNINFNDLSQNPHSILNQLNIPPVVDASKKTGFLNKLFSKRK